MTDGPDHKDMRAQLDRELLDAGLRHAGEPAAPAPRVEAGDAAPPLRDAIATIASTVLKIPPDRLDTREAMSRYGVDSIIVTEIMKQISDLLDLPIAPTVFFEARHLEELADILQQRYPKAVALRYTERRTETAPPAARPSEARITEPRTVDANVKQWIERFRAIAAGSTIPVAAAPEAAPPRAPVAARPGYEPVAIIAMEGTFAESADLRALEQHLRAGDDCIREVPADRWDWRQVFGDPRQGEFTNVKYGGFAPDIDTFDPLFFGMSPREAELMDPQHRLFIQCVWRLIEQAGYAPKSLSGRKVGIFLGINLQDYAHLIDRAGAIEASHLTSLGHMFCPNRLSFQLDIHGPSQVIDTACSSSLVALHRAVLSVQHEGCEMAIAGGANLLITPDMHVMYSKVGMICPDGRCKTFSRNANGYVRGDGVGAVLVKSLARAERDGDTILAVIRGSAENHGGLSTSLTAPNPKAQAQLIVEAHRKAGIDPRSVGYIECHGTGTSLGDPIEINGLKMAFAELHRDAGVAPPDAPYCGLGSVKSNIGHAETAAGIAGVIKAVLSIRNRRLYPTLHCDDINPMIELDGSPFFIAREGAAWQRAVIAGQEQPRRAGVSSFGAGGSNAHVVIEEYATPARAALPETPALIVLSARTEAQLREVVGGLLRFLDQPDLPDLASIAYTLQAGRDAMAERLALIVDQVSELKAKLALIRDGQAVDGAHRGRVKRGSEPAQAVENERDLQRLAQRWIGGARIDWNALYGDKARPRRVTLPTYPFARQRHWIATGTGRRNRRADGAAMHPLLHRDTSDLAERRFSAQFTGREFFLADHVVMGEKVLPGVAYLEMARAAIREAGAAADRDQVALRIRNVVWARPFVFGSPAATLQISLQPEQNRQVPYRITSTVEGGEPVLHAQGTVVLDAPAAAETLDLAALRRSIADGSLDAAACYEAFAAMGIAYGPGHRALERVHYALARDGAPPQALARLIVPDAGKTDGFVLHPGLTDAALQACIGLMAGSGASAPTAALPFGLDELALLAQPAAAMWAWVRYADGSAPADKVRKLDIDLCDDAGQVCMRMRGFSCRTPEERQPVETGSTLIAEPGWVREPATERSGMASTHRTVVLCDLDGFFPRSIEQELASRGVSCVRLPLGGAVEDWYTDAAIGVLDVIKDARKDGVLIQVAVPTGLLAGLSGLLKTANRESSRVSTQLIELDSADDVIARLAAEAGSGEPHIRYRGIDREVLRWRERDHSQPAAVPWKDNGVYLITGGGGGLGLLFAGEIARHTRNATVFLAGRSGGGESQIDRLRSTGLDVRYRTLDVARRDQVDALIAEIVRSAGRLDGILHCAGVLRDNFIPRKSAQELRDVLAPKVAGTLNLDEATKALDLDFVVLFASAAGAWGSAGQADYAAANAFMDAVAHRRSAQVRAGARRGHTVAIDWPLWADGGMRMETAALAMMRQQTGMDALPREAGIAAFNAILVSGTAQALVLHGSAARIRPLLSVPEYSEKPSDAAPAADGKALRARIERMLLEAVSGQMKFEREDLDADTEWNDLGFDSISLTEFSNRLNQSYQLELTPTVFFEHTTAAALAGWLAAEHGAALARALGVTARPVATARVVEADIAPKPAPAAQARIERGTVEPVAIIGMSGRFPMARDLAAFWDNLLAGRDCISEIPPDRWDWQALYGDPAVEPNKTNIKWGGFIDGAGDFDARFFGISPREAERMDPQQRLLMQYAWKAIEDAGYAPASLAGGNTAMFIGTAPSGYAERTVQNGAAIESYSSTGAVGSIGPNRMSYFLNIHGPSEPIETACSSSLIAIHRAIAAMANGDCDQAIVGGINLVVSPETHVSFNKAGMLSPDGRCKTFSRHANGYVRGEGVGMLFLKRLSAAERDGDHIHAVIRGSAENHGGRANSLTAPNPKAQTDLLKTAYTRAGIDPRTVGYIEAHGTGTELGDPIEVDSLKAAFRDLVRSAGGAEVAAHCGLGSVKTNIGHLELAAGIAGVIKVLLQLKHRTLVRTLHCDEVNPYVRLDGSPFYLVTENRAWVAPRDSEGRTLPRRAGISSFGFGGANAHLVVEEYVRADRPASAAPLPRVVVLSAKNEDRLKASAQSLLGFLSAQTVDEGNAPLSETMRTMAAEALGVDRNEIDLARPLDEYGFEHVHRIALHGKVQGALGASLAAAPFLKEHSLAAIVAEVTACRRGSEAASGSPRAGVDLGDLAYTLQVGRDPMDERLAVIVESIDDLKAKLRAFVAGETVSGLHVGQARQNKAMLAALGDEELHEALETWIARGKLDKLADLWAKGLNLDWGRLYGEARPYPVRPRRIPLPGYPFAEQRFWIDPQTPAAPQPAAASTLHPLLHENTSTLRQVRFTTQLTGAEFFLADHRVQGQPVLPGVAYLEMARAAAAHAAPQTRPDTIVRLRDVAWIAPAVVDQPRQIAIELAPAADGAIGFVISTAGQQVHSQGTVSFIQSVQPPRLDPAALQAGLRPIDVRRCYAAFSAAGLDYGPAHRGIVELHAGPDQVLARLVLPQSVAHTLDRFVLHPSLMDAALQASIGLALAREAVANDPPKLALPFAVEAVDVLGACTGAMWAWVRRRGGSGARVQKIDIDLADDTGQVRVRIGGFSARLIEVERAPTRRIVEAAVPEPPAAADPGELRRRTVAHFKELLASTLGFAVADIREDEALDSYGIDSMMVMELTRILEKPFGPLSKTLFFEYQTLGDLVDYFIETYRQPVQALLDSGKPVAPVDPQPSAPAVVARSKPAAAAPPPGTGALDIAIIGLSGRYPQSGDIEAFWRNLRDGKDCITEVPPERWDWRDYYSEAQDGSAHSCKWGGFIADVDKFDPLFFSISPSTAEYMDPQERLFLEHAWMAMEDAGYRREDLRRPPQGSPDDLPGQVGVYAGVMYGEYQLLGLEAAQRGRIAALANFYASIANRVSYALNLHGPSMAVDTMCSSSLTAIHLACQDLKLGRTDMAFAGGVNVSVHPNKYGLLSIGQFISRRGKCESFGDGGDGYVPSEGVGVVLLKRLADAERDGDHIYGVIKSSALNHGGKTNGYSVPNPVAQEAAISRALREAGIDARAIGYIEAHGTGTRLGDPIEITGLSRAFGKHVPPGETCWIGSSKSNIGHTESAAGIAGVTKVLLQMREGQIAPSLHAGTLNPNIDFPATPFRVNQQLREWPRPVIDGRIHPRTAGASSFGAGGANAHLIIEEYVADAGARRVVTAAPQVVVLSARTEEQLREHAGNLLRLVQQAHAPQLADIAYTLQVGREAMPQRLGFVAATMAELAEKLGRYLNGDRAHAGRAKRADDDPRRAAELLARRDFGALAAAWVEGAAIDWQRLHPDDDHRPSRISLPTYPFARERYWIATPEPPRRPEPAAPVEAADAGTLMLRPVWVEQAVARGPALVGEHKVLVVGRLTIPGATQLGSATDPIDRFFGDCAATVLDEIKAAFRGEAGGAFQIVVAADAHLCAALAAMLRTARMENPQFAGQLVELDATAAGLAPDQLAGLLRDNAQSPEPHVRYRQGRREVVSWSELAPDPQPARPVWREGGTYLITGGAGGLGLIFAREIVRQVGNVTLILTGRSQLDAARHAALDALRAQGARVDYRTVDVADAAAVRGLIDSIGGLNGIIHSAGITRDGFLLRKSAADLQAALAAKVSGSVNLDLASRALDLDFLVLFSSISGAVGNPGQCDYATGNAFMDAYAAWRNQLGARGRRLSINWPLWQDGGMDIDAAAKETMWQATGLRPLQTEAGIAAFYRGLGAGLDQVMVLQGDVARLRELFAPRKAPPPAEAVVAESKGEVDTGQLAAKVETLISKMLSDMLKLPLHRIETDVPLEQYGVDSVGMMKLTTDLEKSLGPLPKTLFFEHPTIAEVSAYLAGSFAPKLTALFGPAIARKPESAPPVAPAVRVPAAIPAAPAASRDIAVIGMSGRFPKAADLDEFWQNLVQGRDCISEVPAERWDHSAYFDADRSALGKTSCKWGGFLDGVDTFDARFFRIAPSEAELLDPQERLFLETVWNLLESSGYLGETLQRLTQSRVGVFAGSMSQQYHAVEADWLRASIVALTAPASIANRVSYFFDLQGPSIAIDTMCSSAIIAVHMACESLLKGECKVAIAGGVNLTIHPKKYIALSIGQMIGSSPDSTSFGDGDGYLPAEGVGAVLLKPLQDAIADGDAVLAVIKSTATNHGGQSNGYRVPSTAAQTELIAGNFARSGIDPRTISYVESAANGSRLGDTIEVSALTAGFRQFTADRQFCAIGAVKSNIGHAEAASGMSQLIKVLLQLRHRKLVPTIKADPLNPNIDFAQTPFRLQRKLEDWQRPVLSLGGEAPRAYPRRATVSSFGAGGSNAHLILEEYEAGPAPAGQPVAEPELFVFSARTAAQLGEAVRRMLGFIEQQANLSLADLAYTLQTARETMDHRLALVADSREALVQGLRRRLGNDADSGTVFSGSAEEDNSAIRQLLSGRTGQQMLDLLLAARDLEKLALYWVKGVRIAWQPMHDGRASRRIALPTYPFERTRHWLPEQSVQQVEVAAASEPAFAIDTRSALHDNMERYLRESLSRLLGIPAADIRPGGLFQDLGANSIVLTRLRQGFEQTFGTPLSTRDTLTHPTIEKLAALAAARPQMRPSEPEMPSSPLAGAPLAEGQKALWLLHQMAPRMSAYNVPVALRLGAGLDVDRFRQACEHVLQRYPVLGAVFGERDGEPVQHTAETPRFDFTHGVIDADADVVELLRQTSKQPFDLAHGPLFRVHVLTSGADSIALLTIHHIVCDGRSVALLVGALTQAYAALSAGRALPALQPDTRYGEFVAWQRRFIESDRGRAQRDYWLRQLAGELPALPLPYDHPHPAKPSRSGASHEAVVAPDTANTIRDLARTLGVNLPAIFLGAWMLLLQRYCGEDDIAVGMPVLGRPDARFDDAVGYFVNMIVVRGRITGGQPTGDFLKDLQLTVADGLDNADYPFPAVLAALRAAGGAPDVRVMFAYQNFFQPGAAAPSPEMLPGIHQEGTHDLALEVYEGDGFRLRIDYDTDLFALDTIRRAMDHYVHLLHQVVARPDAALADHALLLPEERQLIAAWSATGQGLEPDGDVIALFRRQADRTSAALLCDGHTVSYRALNQRCTALTQALRDLGVTSSDPVGVCMERGVDMIVALLAIWKAGAIVVPLAPDDPDARMRHVLDDSGATLVIADAQARGRIAALSSGIRCLVPGDVRPMTTSPDAPLRPDDAAYVVYTSGSTGRPKGVAISHRSIAHHVRAMRETFRLTPQDRVLQFAALSVDTALEQILPGLACGATIVIRPTLWSAAEFRRAVAAAGVTVADLPPSYLHEVLLDTGATADWNALRSLRLLITGGEAITPDTVRLWRESPLRGCRLVNAYGPTETTITCTVHEIGAAPCDSERAGNVPIGRPLPGASAFILDRHGQPVPVGMPGELHIGGTGVAIGYLNQPELTAERFVASPLSPASRLYRTGDRARWLADGSIALLGRLDHQVKVRGYRVECGEVEAALCALARQAVVLPREINGSTQLVAFVVAANDGPADLKQALKSRLPDHMIPSVIVRLDAIPTMPSGKVDRIALMRRDLTAVAVNGPDVPRTPVESELAAIWREVLNVERIATSDDFFDVGGHSLLAVRVAALVRQRLGKDIAVSALFEAPTIAAQARRLEEQRPWSPLVCLKANGGHAPWFCVHAVSGDVLAYRALSVGARPIYALQAPPAEAHPGTVEGLAALYLAAIRTVQPHGPYHLGGWSMGGVIAYEMAQQLTEAGERVATLALIDSYTPDAVKTGERDRLWPAPGIEGMTPTYQANARAMDRYVPRAYGGSVQLFAATGLGGGNGMLHNLQLGGWKKLAGDGLTTVPVPGDHDSILRQPDAQRLSDALARYIDDATD